MSEAWTVIVEGLWIAEPAVGDIELKIGPSKSLKGMLEIADALPAESTALMAK